MNKITISTAGFARLNDRLRELKEVLRPEILVAIQKARELGDLSENADYSTAKDKEREINREIRELEALRNKANVVDISSISGDTVMFGASVSIEDEDGNVKKYKILSEYEADLNLGIISITSPMARAIIGKRRGDFAVIRLPNGTKEIEITEISYVA